MKEYIERAALKRELAPYEENDFSQQMDVILAIVDAQPTADVVEVRHGRWIGLEYNGYADGNPVYDLWECSECGEEVRGDDVPSTHLWCHSCGARMDKEAEHEAG